MGAELAFAEYLIVDLERTGEVAVATVGLEDISAHYLPLWRACNLYHTPCELVKQGRLMRSLTDYILCSDCRIFQNVAVQDPRHNSGPLHGHGVSGILPPWVISHIIYVAGYAPLFVYPDVRQGYRQTIFFPEFRHAVPKQNKLVGIKTCGFLSLRGEFCMMVYMSPLGYKSNFFLYSPTILLEKQFSSHQLIFLSSKSEVNQN